jgi:hypothetical protein
MTVRISVRRTSGEHRDRRAIEVADSSVTWLPGPATFPGSTRPRVRSGEPCRARTEVNRFDGSGRM